MDISITDPETNVTYLFTLNEEDYRRAQNDEDFAASLLNSAIKSADAPDVGELQYEPLPMSSPSTSSETKAQHIWQHHETKALINSMQTHIEDLSHPKKRKHVYEKIVNDLNSEGINIGPTQCQVKWKSLIRSYQSTKDNQKKTGRGPSRFLFFEEMDEILGTKPSNQCPHSLESSKINESNGTQHLEPHAEPQEKLHEKATNENKKPKEKLHEKTTKENKKKRNISDELVYYQQEKKNKRHAEKMEIEREKMKLEKEKMLIMKEYLASKNNP